MKYKHRLKRLEARQKWFDNLSKSIQAAYTRPGSKNK
jgi:hypothetical protein